MKTIRNIFGTLLALAASLAWTACNDEVEYTPAGAVDGQGVYFPSTNITTYEELESGSGSIAVNVMRTNSTEAAQVNMSASYSEGAELFSVPASVNFNADSPSSEVTLGYNNLKRGTTYEVTLSFGENTTPYGESSITLSLLYPEEKVVEPWNVVSTNAIYVENLFQAFGVPPLTFTEMTVEKDASTNKYRIQSPYNNEFFQYLFGEDVFADDSNLPYIVLDGETYKEQGYIYIPQTALGFNMENGVGPHEDPSWNCFGSIAGNLQTSAGPIPPDSKDYPLGSYTPATQTFDFGACYFNISGEDGGFLVLPKGSFMLYLDPELMGTDYDRDYTWEDVPEAAGLFTSELLEESWVQAVERAAEDPTFYRMPNLYSFEEKKHLYFNLDAEKGEVTIPKGQDLGLVLPSFGNVVLVQGTPGVSKYDPESGVLTLGLTFYLADEDGNMTAELAQMTETFLWGRTNEFVEGSSIDDYVGNWIVLASDGQSMGSAPVTVAKVDETKLSVKGLSLMAILYPDDEYYDDTMYLEYDPESGQVAFDVQDVAPYLGYPGFVSPCNSVEGLLAIPGSGEALIGGITTGGLLKFVDAPGNQGTYDAMIYAVDVKNDPLMEDGYYMITGFWTYLEWQRAGAKAANIAKGLSKSPKALSPIEKGIVPRRIYKTELDLTPKPVTGNQSRRLLDGTRPSPFLPVK